MAAMKTILQLATSMVASGLLMAGAATAATSIAELPLKASVLAKPNVVFGMDDSGSMDWEILLDTSSGMLWWNGATAWDSAAGKPLKSNATYRGYVYVLPVGTANGGAIYAYNSTNGAALPPTNQFAWVRSAKFNPIYYDTMTTYPAWSPAYVGGALRTYPAATPSAATAHPTVSGAPTLNLTTQWSSTNTNFAANGYTFFVQDGMKVPAGSKLFTTGTGATATPCSGSTTYTTTAEQTVSGGRSCYAAIPYYPATFWQPETCTVGTDCVAAPNGSGTLKRYEIKSTVTTYPSGRTYTAEMQNFANWFSYYRKRKLMLAGSMGRVLENITGLRLGVAPFNSTTSLSMYDADGTSSATNRFAAAGRFYTNAMTSAGTPTHATVKFIAGEFDTNTSVVQYACQRNSMFIVTDGFSNTTSISVPTYDASKWGATKPYTTTPTGSLADLALAYYTNRLRTDLSAGKLPASVAKDANADKNTDLHINTYAITLGVRGSLWPNTVDPFVTAPTWPTPVADDPSMIDDQWHATINGRGKMYLATTPDETAASIRAGLEDILSQKSTQGGLSVSTVNLVRGDSRAYLGSYNPAGWTGDLEAVSVDVVTGDVGTTALWSASKLLADRSWTSRVITSWSGSNGVSFASTVSAVTSAVNPSATYGVDTEVMDYLRGDRTNEGTKFRTRQSLMGPVINAEPVVDRDTGVVYVASGEGMLHAFDTVGADAGKELWAYVPGPVLNEIGKTTARSYAFRTKLDGTPVVRKIDASTRLLVSGLGAAGRGYFAIDVTSPRGLTESTLASKVKWEFPSSSDTTMKSKVGQTLGRPSIVRLASGTTVALVTSGYNNTLDGKGRLWMLNAATGAVIKEFVTSDGSLATESGLTHVAPFAEADGSVRYVFGGDLLGNVWRFDLDADVATGTTKIAQLRGPGGAVQPVTTPPELMYYKGKRIVYIGTGRLLDIGDFGNSDVQSVYAIADGTLLTNARSGLVQQVYTPGGTGTLTTNPVDWTTQRGWFVDLPSGEQMNTKPTIAYGGLAFVTNKAGATDCSASARLYIIDVLTGSKFIGADFVSTSVSETSNASAVAAILTKDGKKVKGISREYNTGAPKPEDLTAGIPIPPMKNSWTEIRR